MDNDMEVWKPVTDFEDLYLVSNLGRIKSLPRNTTPGKILKPTENKGYQYVHLHKNGKSKYYRLHRLVAEAFIPNVHNAPQINHKNGVRNDNRVENLEWCSCKENQIHKFKVLGYKLSEHSSRLRRVRCCETGVEYYSIAEAAKQTGLLAASISNAAGHRSRHKSSGGLHWEYVI